MGVGQRKSCRPQVDDLGGGAALEDRQKDNQSGGAPLLAGGEGRTPQEVGGAPLVASLLTGQLE